MENKYQESLNRLHTSIYEHSVYLNYSSSSKPFEEDIKTIQELIDNYTFLGKEYTKLLKQVDYLAMRVSRDEDIPFASVIGQSLYEIEGKNNGK